MKKFVLLLCVFSLMACAGKRFQQVTPGMSGAEVNKVMKKGPTEVRAYKENYAAWYYSSWGDDKSFCLLMQNDKVVSKEKDQDGTSVSVPGLGTYHERTLANCVPPGELAEDKTERNIELENTPFGRVKTKR